MSEVQVEKVYVRNRPSGRSILVNSLGMELGRQELIHLHGDSSGMKSATVKLALDGRWSTDVMKEYIKSATHAAAVLSGRVVNTDTGKAMEFELPEVSPEYVMVNGEKFVRESGEVVRAEDLNRMVEFFPDAARLTAKHKGVDIASLREQCLSGGLYLSEIGSAVLGLSGHLTCELGLEKAGMKTSVAQMLQEQLDYWKSVAMERAGNESSAPRSPVFIKMIDGAPFLVDEKGCVLGSQKSSNHGPEGVEVLVIRPDGLVAPGEQFELESVEVFVDGSAIETLRAVQNAVSAEREKWSSLVESLKSRAATGTVSIAGELAAFEPFPICPLESAISETVRHLREDREEFHRFKKDGIDVGDGLTERLGQHLESLLREQYKRLSK